LASQEKTDLRPPTYPLTKYERARILGGRALQISLGAFPLVEVRPGDTHLDIAIREFESGILPIVVRRKRPNGSYEDIPLAELLKSGEQLA